MYLFRLFYPFILGAAIAFVLNVLLNIVEKKWLSEISFKNKKRWNKVKRPVALICSLLLILFVLIFICGLVIPELKNTASIFIENIPEYSVEISKTLSDIGVSTEEIEQLTTTLNTLRNDLSSYIKNNSNQILTSTIGFASSLITSIGNFVIGIVFAIYILLQKEKLMAQLDKIMRVFLSDKQKRQLNRIGILSHRTFANFISGQCVEAVIIGGLCFIGMIILQIPYAPTISVLVGFTALIPVFGAFIGTGIGAFLILMVSPMKALIFIIFILILQQLEGNLIYPKVVGKSVGLPGIWVMVAVTIGASISGVVGILLSVPISSILYSILATFVNEKLKQKENAVVKLS